MIHERVLIGFSLSLDESYCTDLSWDEFTDLFLRPSTVVKMTTVACHGLKRVGEFVGQRGLRTDTRMDTYLNINKIDDAQLMAYLLDPDSSREVDC